MRTRLLLSIVCFSACGPAGADDDAYVDHEPGVWRAGLTAGEAGGCDTSIVAGLTGQLVAELNCITPNTMVDFRGANITVSGAVQPYLHPSAANALKAAVAASGTSISLSSAYRSVAQQYLLLKWFRAGQCGIQAAALPGNSNHQSGRAIDVPSYSAWISRLQAQGWTWFGSGDAVHFDFLAAPNAGSTSVLAFQKLWNKNNPNKLDEDGDWGPLTEAAMAASPTTGFAVSGCGPVMPMTGTLKGRVYAVNPADPMDLSRGLAGATVVAGGKTLTADATGLYEVALPAGTYTVTASSAGFEVGTVSRMVTAGQIVWGSVGLTASGAPDTVGPEIVLVSPATASQVAAAEITLTGTASDARGTVASLKLSLNGAPGADLQLTQGAFSQTVKLVPGANALRFTAADDRGNVSELDVALTFTTGVDGVVFSMEGGVEAATVEAIGAGWSVSVQSAADGTFHLDLLPGPYTLRAHAEGLALFEAPLQIGVERREEATLSLMPEPMAPVKGGCASAPGVLLAGVLLLVARARSLSPRRGEGRGEGDALTSSAATPRRRRTAPAPGSPSPRR